MSCLARSFATKHCYLMRRFSKDVSAYMLLDIFKLTKTPGSVVIPNYKIWFISFI